jgi:2,5-dihydroxypyridine 5,6-dioxygenase
VTIEQGARIIVEEWLRAKRNEVYHYITDETKLKEADAFIRAAENAGAVTKMTVLKSSEVQKGNTIEEMRQIMSYADVIIGATNYSFITTDAVQYALHHGARFLSLPLSTNDGSSLLQNDFLSMSPSRAAMMSRPVMHKLNRSETIHVTTRLGTDITFLMKGRRAGYYNGRVGKPGQCSSASFEVYVPVVESGTEGRVVLDGSFGYIGLVHKPLVLEFTGGYLKKIGDTEDGRKLKEYLAGFHDREMYCAAEFGIGMNECSRCRGVAYIEDESAYGTFHIGFGRNLALGGKHDASGHFDIVTHEPTIIAGTETVMQDGVRVPGHMEKYFGRLVVR